MSTNQKFNPYQQISKSIHPHQPNLGVRLEMEWSPLAERPQLPCRPTPTLICIAYSIPRASFLLSLSPFLPSSY